MSVELVRKEDILASVWSGGQTNEYSIKPNGVTYASRAFLFRISSATIESVPSVFTQFDGYKRYLVMLEGDLELDRNNTREYYINRSLFVFHSSDKVVSYSKGKDFNLMLSERVKNERVEVISKNRKVNCTYFFLFALSDIYVRLNEVGYNLNQYDCLILSNVEEEVVNLELSDQAIVGYW